MLDKLLSEEKSFHIYGLNEIKRLLRHKLLILLVDCIADDEKKHERILKSLVNYARISEGFPHNPFKASEATGRR